MNSLQLNGYELIGTVTNPEYRLGDETAWGQPEPDTATISGVLLDGDRVVGNRSANRQMSIPVGVFGTSATDLAAKVNRLISIVDSPTFTLAWGPQGGLPVIYTGYRGSWTRERLAGRDERFIAAIRLTFPAAPFGRSDTPQQITTSSATLQVDSFDSAPTGATLDTTNKVEGTGSAAVTLNRQTSGSKYSYLSGAVSRTYAGKDLSAYASLRLRVRWPSPDVIGADPWYLTVTMTLGDGTNTAAGSAVLTVPEGSTDWLTVAVPLSAFSTANPALNLTAVTSESFVLSSAQRFAFTAPAATSTANIDDFRAYPSSSVALATSEAEVLTIPAVQGSARTPVNLTVTRGGSAMTNGYAIHRPPVDQDPDAKILTALTGSPGSVTGLSSKGLSGTYTVVLIVGTAGSGTRTVTVTFTQKNPSGITLGTQAVSAVVVGTPSTGKYLIVGEVTLPIVGITAENTGGTYDIAVTSGATASTYKDLMLFNTRGQMLVVGGPVLSSLVVAYVDEPPPAADIGPVYMSASDRTRAAVTGVIRSSGGPILLEPGDNQILGSNPDGPLTITASYYPRWLDERDV